MEFRTKLGLQTYAVEWLWDVYKLPALNSGQRPILKQEAMNPEKAERCVCAGKGFYGAIEETILLEQMADLKARVKVTDEVIIILL